MNSNPDSVWLGVYHIMFYGVGICLLMLMYAKRKSIQDWWNKKP